MVTSISRDELKDQLDGPLAPVVVEALPPMYYEKGHLPGAINIPHDEVDVLAPNRLPDKTAAIVVYCANQGCQNSSLAAHRLVQLGYTRVYEYEAGKADWEEAGLPVVQGQASR